jgi:glutaredoxin
MGNSNSVPPDALLLLSTQCPHCATVLQGLSELVKKGAIGRLEVVNIVARPDIAQQQGVRTVPWLRLGDFQLEGLHSPAELRQWAERAGSETGLTEYYRDLFKHGQLHKAQAAINKHPGHISALLALAEDPDTELTVRIGVSAVMEDAAGSALLQDQLAALTDLARHSDPRVRSDACHFLALTRSEAALAPLETLSRDTQPAVQEVAKDSLAELREHLKD